MNQNTTNWAKVREDTQADAPIIFDPETDPYDPNDEAATLAYWRNSKIIKTGTSMLSKNAGVPHASTGNVL